MPHSCEDACSKILAKPAVKISRHQIKKLVELDKRAFRARVKAEQRRAKIIVARGATPSPPPSPPSPPSPPPSAPSPSTLLSPSGKKVSTLTHAHAHARASSLPLLLKVGTLTHIIARNAPPHHEEAAISEAISGALARPETLALTLTLSNVSATTHPTGTLPSSLSGVSSDTMVRSSEVEPRPHITRCHRAPAHGAACNTHPRSSHSRAPLSAFSRTAVYPAAAASTCVANGQDVHHGLPFAPPLTHPHARAPLL